MHAQPDEHPVYSGTGLPQQDQITGRGVARSACGLWPGWPPLDLPMAGCHTSINWPQELFGAKFFQGTRRWGAQRRRGLSRGLEFFLLSLLQHKRELYIHVHVGPPSARPLKKPGTEQLLRPVYTRMAPHYWQVECRPAGP